ncbi:family 20 glycosylhydrolase [Litorilituus lipolyticus]|nr:family 20 glycosylhydrolase [Litorilituus lipolyticus]
MNKNFLVLSVIATLSIVGCNEAVQNEVLQVNESVQESERLIALHSATQTDIDDIAKNLDVSYQVVTNVPSEKCDKEIANGACFEVELTFKAQQGIDAKDWSIYFSQIAPIQSFESKEFEVKHINGDMHQITLQNSYSGFKKAESKTLLFRAMFWSLSESDPMPNYIVEAPNTKAQVIESTKAVIDTDTGLEILPHVIAFTDKEKQFKRSANDKTQWLNSAGLYKRNDAMFSAADVSDTQVSQTIIPTPKEVIFDSNNAVVDISNGFNLMLGNVKQSDVDAALSRLVLLSVNVGSDKQALPLKLAIESDENKAIGSYQLSVTSTGVIVTGVDGNGVFNGLQSLAALVEVGKGTIPIVEVVDEPHYSFRGMLVDVARNFHSKAFILNLLEQMAAYKLNKLHLHLGDDEGWRLEIPSLPELTDIGSKRCFDTQEQTCLMPQLGAGVDPSSKVNGYYSVADYQEILQAATARHIQVIPSLDMPGHSRSSVKAMTARFNKFQQTEEELKAKQYLLDDFNDTTKYSSVQFYSDNTINVCLESSYDFVIEVMSQVKAMHAEAGQPLTRYHIGADETAGAWVDSPACKAFVANNDKGITDMKELGAYFIERVAGILSDLDIETAGWSDGMEHTRKENMPAIVQANAWDALFWSGHDKVHTLVNRDWQVVVSSPDALYFDFPYEADPKEHGYYWASRHTNTEKVFQFMPDNLPVHAEFWLDREGNPYEADDSKIPMKSGTSFLGVQGQLWSENTRSDDMVEHKVFPRLLALAERAWHFADWAVPYNYEGAKYSQQTRTFTQEKQQARDKQWRLFATTLGHKEFAKLELANIDYRLPTVGAIVKAGKLHANVAFPGLAIEFQEGEGKWQLYQEPIAVKDKVKVRSVSVNGQRRSRTVDVITSKP